MSKRQDFFNHFFLCSFFFFILPGLIHAQTSAGINSASRGDPAIAEQYAAWAENAIEQGRWSEALIVLERGADYADVSSDISYLLARARSRFNKPRGSIMEALGRALRADYWNKYSREDALLLEAENLISLQLYEEALNVLTFVNDSLQSAGLKLQALRFSSRTEEFFRYTEETMNRYPRESGFAKIFLDYLGARDSEGNYPRDQERTIFDLVQRRLPLLIQDDPELAWKAAPFIRDPGEAERMVAAYRAIHDPAPASIPIALKLGIISEDIALEELFGIQNRYSGLDLALLDEIWDLLRNGEAKDSFRQNLLNYTGIIFRDANHDGIPEEAAEYSGGMLQNYYYDPDQDGLPDFILNFVAGETDNALVTQTPEAGTGKPAFPAKEEDLNRIRVQWEQYPALLEAELQGERFIFRPLDFFYAPVKFREFPELSGSRAPARGILFPERDPMAPALTRRNLTAHALRVERPSREFNGAVEVIELNQSIPITAREYLNGRLVSETDFLRGRPLSQRIDLNLDGRMETVRHFRRTPAPGEVMDLLDYQKDFDYADSDRDGDGFFETREYFGD